MTMWSEMSPWTGIHFVHDAQSGLYLPFDPSMLSWGSIGSRPFSITRLPAVLMAEQGPDEQSARSALWKTPTVVMEEIVAYRSWALACRIVDDNGTLALQLRSPRRSVVWEGPVMLADAVPTDDNDNGLYAVGTSPEHHINFDSYIEDEEVWGRVALSGVVEEGENGYRAERMTIQELWLQNRFLDQAIDSVQGIIKLLGERYQCDVSCRDALWDDIADAGPE